MKKRLGGAYPGQKIPQHSPYVPPASAFGKDGTGTAHFVAHGGGNALTLVQSDGNTAPQVGKYQPDYIQGECDSSPAIGPQLTDPINVSTWSKVIEYGFSNML